MEGGEKQLIKIKSVSGNKSRDGTDKDGGTGGEEEE